MSRFGNFVAKTGLGLQAMDTTAGFRLYRREVLEAIHSMKSFQAAIPFWLKCSSLPTGRFSSWRSADHL